jgi:hypothetical protein
MTKPMSESEVVCLFARAGAAAEVDLADWIDQHREALARESAIAAALAAVPAPDARPH